MYLHRSKEDRERIVRLSRENIQREKVAERLAKGPYFKKIKVVANDVCHNYYYSEKD